jgi:hypothetical protein
MSTTSEDPNTIDPGSNSTALPPPPPPPGPSVTVVKPSAAAIAIPIIVFFGIVAAIVAGYFAFNHWSRRREAIETRARRASIVKQQQLDHARKRKAREEQEERHINGEDWEMEEVKAPGVPGSSKKNNDSPV